MLVNVFLPNFVFAEDDSWRFSIPGNSNLSLKIVTISIAHLIKTLIFHRLFVYTFFFSKNLNIFFRCVV